MQRFKQGIEASEPKIISIILFFIFICMQVGQGVGHAEESIVRIIYSGNHFGEIEPCG